jgi:MoaA/NifB/PqqE/SkfB family radical SAM enzyme
MAVPTAREILNWCCGHVREVTLLGGEPSLHPEVAVIADVAKNAGFAVRLVTNGSSPFRRLLDDMDFVANLDSVAISLDHVIESEVEALRGRLAFSDAVQSIEILQDLNVPFAINCCVSASLLEYIEEMIQFAERRGAFRLNLHWLSSVGRARSRLDLRPDPDQWSYVLKTVREYRAPRSDFVVDCELGWLAWETGEFDARRDCAAYAGTNLQFLPDGRVFSCGLIVESDLHGYVWRDGSLWRRLDPRTELLITASGVDCHGCPIRLGETAYSHPADTAIAPACIYQRAHSRSEANTPHASRA